MLRCICTLDTVHVALAVDVDVQNLCRQQHCLMLRCTFVWAMALVVGVVRCICVDSGSDVDDVDGHLC